MTGLSKIALFAFLSMNTVLWVILTYAGWQVARELWRAPQQTEAKLQAVVLVWMMGALSFCLLNRPQTRFGASFYVFLLLFLACFLFPQPRAKYLRLIPVLIMSLVTVAKGVDFLWNAGAIGLGERRLESALFTCLKSLPQDGRTVLVVNAPSMLSAPVFLPNSWNLRLKIVFINQFQGCARAQAGDAQYDLSSTALSVKIPPCAYYVFAGVPEGVQSKILNGDLIRPGVGVYQFPGHPNNKREAGGDIDFGRAVQIRFQRPPETVLAYDWQQAAYRVLRATCLIRESGMWL